MLEFSWANLIAGIIFGSIGFVAFTYGKRLNLWTPMICGLGLMIYPYFIANTIALFAIGLVGTAALFVMRS